MLLHDVYFGLSIDVYYLLIELITSHQSTGGLHQLIEVCWLQGGVASGGSERKQITLGGPVGDIEQRKRG